MLTLFNGIISPTILLIIWIIVYTALIYSTVPSKSGRAILMVYGVLLVGLFKITINGVPLI